MSYKKTIEELFEIRMKQVISNDFLNLIKNCKYEIIFDDFINSYIMSISTKFYGNKTEKISEIEEIKYPKNIWEYFKERYLPEFFIRKFPIKYETERIIIKNKTVNYYINYPTFIKNEENIIK